MEQIHVAKATERLVDKLVANARVAPRTKVQLAELSTRESLGMTKSDADVELLPGVADATVEYQARLSAEGTRSLLMAFQGMDGAGKDGAIKHVLTGLNPQGVRVTAFKAPGGAEIDHDYLWRHNQALPRRGQIGVFNRSHYEEVLITRVHPGVLEAEKMPPELKAGGVWRRRYRQINDWERYLTENGVTMVKIFLHLSWEEQRQRFLERIDQPQKNWKFSDADVRERDYWNKYQHAYEQMVSATSTSVAPWYAVPADRKWFARLTIRAILYDTIRRLDPAYPTAPDDHLASLASAKAYLESQG